MSTVLTLPAKELKECFSALSLIAAKGSQLTPVSLILKDQKLSFVCLQGCIVQGSIAVASNEIANAVFMYYDVTPIMPPSGNVDVALYDYGVTVAGESFTCSFPTGYSDVTEFEFSDHKFTKIENNAYIDSFRVMLGMNLDKLYSKPVPVTVFGNVAVVKHSCCYVQTRMYNLPYKAQIDAEHVKMIMKFKPWEVSASSPNTLVFRKGNIVLQIPCRTGIGENDFPEFLKDMKTVCMVNAGGLYEKVNYTAKVSSKSKCTILTTARGIKISVNIDNASSSISNGDMSGDITFTTFFPISTLLAFLRAIGDDTMEILTGGELLCLRTQNLIILVRVEY